jgi:hypothetical protein
MRIYAILIAAGVALPVGSPAAAQTVTALTTADASFPESFSTVRGLRELPDGRILIADGLGQVLVIVDLDAGTVDTVGRVGGGPSEYRLPDRLFALPGDSILLVDLGNGRLTVLDPDLRFGRTYPIMAGSGEGYGSTTLRLPRGIDGRGRIYFQQSAGIRPGSPVPDSAAVVRWNPADDTVDTVAVVKVEKRKLERVGDGMRLAPTPMSPQDGWAIGQDGSIALVRSGEYRVEWIRSNGSVVRGPANPFEPVKIGNAEKEAWVDTRSRDGLSVAIDIAGGGARQASFSRGGASGARFGIDDYTWPEYMQAFDAGGVYITPSGMLWVERAAREGASVTFDVFDTDGRLTRRVMLPTGREIAGFGAGVLYTVTADEFDLMWLERFRIDT